MHHIADCMTTDSDGEIDSLRSGMSSTFSARSSMDSLSSDHSREERRSFASKMRNQKGHKYRLFPRDRELPPVHIFNPGSTSTLETGLSRDRQDKSDKSGLSNDILLKLKGHNLMRRHKGNVPGLGQTTTEQEVLIDSFPEPPTLQERSIGSPIKALKMNLPMKTSDKAGLKGNTGSSTASNPKSLPDKQPPSPKELSHFTTSSQSGTLPSFTQKFSLSRLRSGNNSLDQLTRLRSDESAKAQTFGNSLLSRSAMNSTTSLKSAPTNMTTSSSPTPIYNSQTHRSPSPWVRSQSSMTVTLQAKHDPDVPIRSVSAFSHRRDESDSGSIMERGHPLRMSDGTNLRRDGMRRSQSAERIAYETLPQGYEFSAATKKLDEEEITHLQRQALGQAARFEVLKKEDVNKLSKELRLLDERTEYLRHTYTSLRAGRRNLQSRICQYLRTPRTEKFSYESVLRQEESLAEIDAAIDDWAIKLEHAENRRMRIRQKLLEHLAAAAAMSATTNAGGSNDTPQDVMSKRMLLHPSDALTLPRRPTNGPNFLDGFSARPSSSPQQGVADTRSSPIKNESEESQPSRSQLGLNSTQSALQRMESIRIYADNDIYSLLEDVENGFTKLSHSVLSPELISQEQSMTYDNQRTLAHARSYEVLCGGSPSNTLRSLNNRHKFPPPPSPPLKDQIFLTTAVFRA
ncbi:hypothetical protein GGS21DRAFT_412069 [Xylaria nigripes]|nr:hypothetical protein GGS21DRAFT_412069 [Xylaria nigripes]